MVLLTSLAMSGTAMAQVSGSVSLVSNYLYRGVSLSDGNPEAQWSLNADFDGGWFAGAFATPVDLPGSRVQGQAYAGYARQWSSELSWEAGLSETIYAGNGGENYQEGFIGLSSERLNGRLYYSPDYLGQSTHSVYGELNFNLPLGEKLRLVAHGGYLSLPGEGHGAASRGDARVGLAYHLGEWNLQWALATVRQSTTAVYHYQRVDQHPAGVFDAAWNF